MFWWVVGLSVAGAAFELAGIILVSGRWTAIRDSGSGVARGWWAAIGRYAAGLRPSRGRPSPQVGTIGQVEEHDSAGRIPPKKTVPTDEARYRLLEATVQATRNDLSAVGRQASDVAGRLDRLEKELPDEIRRGAAAPVWGVVYLVAGLGCFVAANIVGAVG